MRSLSLLSLAVALLAVPALAQNPGPAAVPPQDRPLVEEERPDFQPLRPAEPDEPVNAAPIPAAPIPAAPTPSVPAPVVSAPVAPPPVAPAPVVPVIQPPPPAALPEREASLPLWLVAPLVVLGGLLAGLLGVLASRALRRGELTERRRAVAACLAAELETRRLAFDAVPLPPNVEAGVSFVSAVISMAGIDCAFRSVQASLFLLSPVLAANISVHYAAVQRVADFVKGQSLAAAVRMMQANRLGGHPCPDAGAMREAHVELAAAFRGLDKVILSLNALQR